MELSRQFRMWNRDTDLGRQFDVRVTAHVERFDSGEYDVSPKVTQGICHQPSLSVWCGHKWKGQRFRWQAECFQ
jgi:hypothetical protein